MNFSALPEVPKVFIQELPYIYADSGIVDIFFWTYL